MTAPDIIDRADWLTARIDAEMGSYSDAAYATHGDARDQLERFAADVMAPLRAQLEAAQADAERWRFVRDHATVSVDEYVWITTSSGHRIHVTSACAGAEAEQLIDASIVIHKARGVKP
jgi:hypothetical protein